jgi:phospholipid/cholesterol/gamma-HCH transport system ATP-binding protein
MDAIEHSDVNVIEVRELCKAFGSNTVLDKFSMDLRKGENVAVIGKSGSGKSVLIKCVIGLLHADSGSIVVLKEEINQLNQKRLEQLRARVGFLFQSNALYDSMTVRENLEFPLRRHRVTFDETEVNKMVLEALENVGLKDTVDMMPAELSGGMRKRIALARTLILKPEIILYDEPTTGLDPVTGREISNLIVEVQKKYNASSIIISHDMRCVQTTSDRIVMLIEGRAYATDTYENLKKSSDPKINAFF